MAHIIERRRTGESAGCFATNLHADRWRLFGSMVGSDNLDKGNGYEHEQESE